MGFVVDGVNTSFKMEGIMKDNGKRAKCMDLEDYIINRKILRMMDFGSEVNFQEKGSFIISILYGLRYLSSTIIYLWCRISGLIIMVHIWIYRIILS